MSVPDEAKRLFSLAERDLRSMGTVIEEPEFAEETYAFLAQQAVEKGLKSLIEAQGTMYPLTHDLARLFALVANRGLIEPFRDLATLFPYAVLFRYSDAEEVEPFDRQALHDRPAAFLQAVRQELRL